MAKVAFITFYNDYSVAVASLSTTLIKAGHDVSALFFKIPSPQRRAWFSDDPTHYEHVVEDGYIYGQNIDINKWTKREVELLINKLNELGPDIIAISSRSHDNELISDVLPQILKNTKAKIISGGYGPTLDPQFYAQFSDYVFMGEGEDRIEEVIEALAAGHSLKKMKNICYLEGDKLIKNKLSAPDMSQPRFQSLPDDTFYIENDTILKFNEGGGPHQSHCYHTTVGRGCISSCSYCFVGHWEKIYAAEGFKLKKRRNRPVENIIDELIKIKNKGYTFVFFRDEFLSAPGSYFKELFTLYEKHINLPFWAQFVPSQMIKQPGLLEMAVNAGFVATEIGFQTADDDFNREVYNRFITTQDTVDYVKLLHEYKINMKWSFIFFNPLETETHIEKTIKLIQDLPKTPPNFRGYPILSRLTYKEGTPISKSGLSKKVKPEDYDRYYSQALLYFLCFVMPEDEFEVVHKKYKSGIYSAAALLNIYQLYLTQNNLKIFPGTHEIPNSITTHRYERILKRKKYSDVIVWGVGEYYKEMAHIFNDVNIYYHIDDGEENCLVDNTQFPDTLLEGKKEIPIFICSKRKQDIKMRIIRDYPDYADGLYV